MLVIAGVAVVLIGMYVQWIRWRMYKPLSFAPIPVGPQSGAHVIVARRSAVKNPLRLSAFSASLR